MDADNDRTPNVRMGEPGELAQFIGSERLQLDHHRGGIRSSHDSDAHMWII
jgi:hypothetical protein